MQKVIIIGAGPAGLTAADKLLDEKEKYDVTILEETSEIGGISRTVKYNGNRMDIGGHRFFSKDPKVMKYWEELMPIQGENSFDDEELKRKNEELFKKRQQFLQSANTVSPAQPSFDSSSNTSASNASTQNAETQRFNATNQVQKDIKEINSLMLDALERIERGQQRQTQQLENIGFMATSKNTGMI